jgi:hypothetical protein
MKSLGKVYLGQHLVLANQEASKYGTHTVIHGTSYEGWKVNLDVEAMIITEFDRIPTAYRRELENQLRNFKGQISYTECKGGDYEY